MGSRTNATTTTSARPDQRATVKQQPLRGTAALLFYVRQITPPAPHCPPKHTPASRWAIKHRISVERVHQPLVAEAGRPGLVVVVYVFCSPGVSPFFMIPTSTGKRGGRAKAKRATQERCAHLFVWREGLLVNYETRGILYDLEKSWGGIPGGSKSCRRRMWRERERYLAYTQHQPAPDRVIATSRAASGSVAVFPWGILSIANGCSDEPRQHCCR